MGHFWGTSPQKPFSVHMWDPRMVVDLYAWALNDHHGLVYLRTSFPVHILVRSDHERWK